MTVCNSLMNSRFCKECPIEVLEKLILALDNILEAEKLINIYFDSLCNECCRYDCSFIEGIIERLDRAIRLINEVIEEFNGDCYRCSEDAGILDLIYVRNSLESIKYTVLSLAECPGNECYTIYIASGIQIRGFARILGIMRGLIVEYKLCVK